MRAHHSCRVACQAATSSPDFKLLVWSTFDGALLSMLDGSRDPITAVSVRGCSVFCTFCVAVTPVDCVWLCAPPSSGTQLARLLPCAGGVTLYTCGASTLLKTGQPSHPMSESWTEMSSTKSEKMNSIWYLVTYVCCGSPLPIRSQAARMHCGRPHQMTEEESLTSSDAAAKRGHLPPHLQRPVPQAARLATSAAASHMAKVEVRLCKLCR